VGRVFAVFGAETQDSGNVSYGVRVEGERFFVKTAGDEDDPRWFVPRRDRVALPRNAIRVRRSCAHAVGDDDAAQPAEAGVRVGRETRSLLVATDDRPQVAGGEHVEQPQGVVARQAEHVLQSSAAKLPDEVLADLDGGRGRSLVVLSCIGHAASPGEGKCREGKNRT
jgi:hypothetical protein